MNILIVGPSWVGDTVISQSLLKLLAQNPNRALTRDWLLETVAREAGESKA